MSIHGDSKMIEEKLDQVNDLKTQIRCLISDNEEVKLNQEELNANMSTITHQMSLLADAFEKLTGNGRTDVFRRVSRMSKQSFRNHLPAKSQASLSPNSPVPQSPPVIQPPKTPQLGPKTKRKASLEGIVKTLTDLAVSISTDDVKGTLAKETAPSAGGGIPPSIGDSGPEHRLLDESDYSYRRDSGSSLPGRLIDKKLKRTNLMKRRESQAFLEGVRKIRGAQSNADSGHNSNDNA